MADQQQRKEAWLRTHSPGLWRALRLIDYCRNIPGGKLAVAADAVLVRLEGMIQAELANGGPLTSVPMEGDRG